jgi:hypothetical protein
MTPEMIQVTTVLVSAGLLFLIRSVAIKTNADAMDKIRFPVGEPLALMLEKKRIDDLSHGIFQTDGEARS